MYPSRGRGYTNRGGGPDYRGGGGGRERGRRNNPTGQSFRYNDNREENSSGEQQQGDAAPRKKFEGPVFGFKRLFNFVNSPVDDVIGAIHRDLKAWQLLLDDDSIAATRTLRNGQQEMSDDTLVLIVTLLAEKICSDSTVLSLQQNSIISSSASSHKFLSKIDEKVKRLMFQGGDDSSTRKRRPMNGSGDNEMQVDQSRIRFFKNLLTIFRFIAKKMPSMALDFLGSVVPSVIGALLYLNTSNHSEEGAKLLADFMELKALMDNIKLKSDNNKEKEETGRRRRNYDLTAEEEQELHETAPPDDFREMSIIPHMSELLSPEETFLRPNKKSGAYNDHIHYLDVQFRLLREDFVRPLKDGIQDYLKNKMEYLSRKKRPPIGNVRLYHDVRLAEVKLVKGTMVTYIQLHSSNYARVKWDRSKRLLNGSLLVFTPDDFVTAHLAIVHQREEKDLKKGVFGITWEGLQPPFNNEESFLMVECEVYFEAYRYTLQILKEIELEVFPLSKYIVKASTDVNPPRYLSSSGHLMKIGKYECSPLLDRSWPSAAELSLDDKQYEAFKACLTKEFAIVQGPPGTGKTFLALQIVEVLLRNPLIWSGEGAGPILLVAYTNHALDAFLEGSLKVFEKLCMKPSLIRVGGRSKTEALDEFSLMRQRMVASKLRTYDHNYARMKREAHESVRNTERRRANLMTELLALNNLTGIVDLNELTVIENLEEEISSGILTQFNNPAWFGLDAEFDKVNLSNGERLKRLFKAQIGPVEQAQQQQPPPQQRQQQQQQGIEEDDSDSDEYYDAEELLSNRIIDDIYMEAERSGPEDVGKTLHYLHADEIRANRQKIGSLKAQMDNVTSNKDLPHMIRRDKVREIEEQVRKNEFLLREAEKRESFILTVLKAAKEKTIELPNIDRFVDLQSMGVEQRCTRAEKWALFFHALTRAKLLTATAVKDVNDKMSFAQKNLQQVLRQGDGQIVRRAKIVGMTTTGAAKYNDILRMANSRIVIVEEAAEILESHIVTCLTPSTEHLILIGDHRQLRPSTTVHSLAVKHNLDISLFERMVNNNLNCYRLNVQHRMRPEISNLIAGGTIYDELFNARIPKSVYDYPCVPGMVSNLYFITHDQAESSETDNKSKSNEFEAKLVTSLSRYLVQQGYTPDKITVLSTYLGQMFLIKQKMKVYPTCQGIRVTCVDNFQGEENEIIILSLVRSNEEGNVGFLKIDNRICVALSRAKQGMYIVGNMSKLAMRSKTWKAIQEKLKNRDEIGPTITVQCKVHGTINDIASSEDMQRLCPEGGCLELCNAELKNCSHRCVSVCHINDRHNNCQFPCEKRCPSGHLCKDKCFRKCSPCPVKVIKTLPCMHELEMACFASIDTIVCQILVEKTLSCGHQHNMACHVDPSKFKCRIKVVKTLPCQHKKEMECLTGAESVNCRAMVKKTLNCGHEQEDVCWKDVEYIKCESVVTVNFPDCGHKTELKCAESRKPGVKCRNPCTVRLSCGHSCTLLCHTDRDPDHLTFPCKKPCGRICSTSGDNGGEEHRCSHTHPCHLPCPPCKKTVKRKRPCEHEIELECRMKVEEFGCISPCKKTLNCGHPCVSLCSKPCPPCQIPVKKRSMDCLHMQQIACSESYSRRNCEFKVTPSRPSICLHNVQVPCRISYTVTPEDSLKYCENPCNYHFDAANGGCGHTCKGSCSSCLHGRLHVKCKDKCGRTLVCGHSCTFPCSVACPPCRATCQLSCEHSTCSAKCGDPCEGCVEPCKWQCPHKTCTKLCSDLCDREPCNEPCPKLAGCGKHPCISFCGEPCPHQCRICDRTELEEFILYGNEENEDARFILLEDCGHAIEHEGLEYYMTHDIEEGEIVAKRCPRCKQLIRKSRRFGNVLKISMKNVSQVKTKKFGMTQETTHTYTVLVNKIRKSQLAKIHFPEVTKFIKDKLFKEIVDINGISRIKTNKVDAWTLATLDLMGTHLEDALKQVTSTGESRGQTIQLKDEFMWDMVRRFNYLFDLMIRRQIPLSKAEVDDFDMEFDRLFDLKQIYLQASVPQFTPGHARAQPIYNDLLSIIDHPCRQYDRRIKNILHQRLKELAAVLATGLGISDRERREILAAFGDLREGHWFKCPNGHIYIITECGGAMQESVCNECGAGIGGGSHRLRSDNRLAGEMDGATRPLWPQ